MIIQKTYGVTGLMEWSVLIKMGKKEFHILFTGGMVTSTGVIPAVYTTKNVIVQLAIESSQLFANGQIKLLKSVSCEESTYTESPENATHKSKEGIKSVKVECADDAKDYLCDHYQCVRTKLNSKEAIKKMALENGIEFVGI